MKKYKYTQVRRKRVFSNVELNEYGSKGWNLVSILVVNGEYNYTFKREDVCVEEDGGSDDCGELDYGIQVGDVFVRTIKGCLNHKLLSMRCYNALVSNGIETISDLKAMPNPIEQCKVKRNFGRKSISELDDFLNTQIFTKKSKFSNPY